MKFYLVAYWQPTWGRERARLAVAYAPNEFEAQLLVEKEGYARYDNTEIVEEITVIGLDQEINSKSETIDDS